MRSISEIERELAEARARQKRKETVCIACDGKGWTWDTTYDRTGIHASCSTCYGSGLPKTRVDKIIKDAFAPFRKPSSAMETTP